MESVCILWCVTSFIQHCSWDSTMLLCVEVIRLFMHFCHCMEYTMISYNFCPGRSGSCFQARATMKNTATRILKMPCSSHTPLLLLCICWRVALVDPSIGETLTLVDNANQLVFQSSCNDFDSSRLWILSVPCCHQNTDLFLVWTMLVGVSYLMGVLVWLSLMTNESVCLLIILSTNQIWSLMKSLFKYFAHL